MVVGSAMRETVAMVVDGGVYGYFGRAETEVVEVDYSFEKK